MWKITLEDDRMVFTPFFGDPTADQDPDHLREELQDLKLENDRLQQRDKIMLDFIECVATSRQQWLSVRAHNVLKILEDLG